MSKAATSGIFAPIPHKAHPPNGDSQTADSMPVLTNIFVGIITKMTHDGRASSIVSLL